MSSPRLNRDFSKGPVFDQRSGRWLVEIRYPDDTRFRKRFKREREANKLWGAESVKIEKGTWEQERSARNVTLGHAMEGYHAFSRAQHRAYARYINYHLQGWEDYLGSQTRLARITTQQVEAYKLLRVESVCRTTVDKDLASLKAFFNWCIDHQLAAWTPVRRVKLFHEDNTRLRYLTREEYDRLIASARELAERPLVSTPSPYLEEKIVLVRAPVAGLPDAGSAAARSTRSHERARSHANFSTSASFADPAALNSRENRRRADPDDFRGSVSV